MKRRTWPAVSLLTAVACTASTVVGSTGSSGTGPAPTSTSASITTTTSGKSTAQILADLGGGLCPESDFTCVTVEMPLDHFDPANPETIPVTFAVLPAPGDPRGAFVTATGGPGSAGIVVADSYTSALDPAILGSYDVVFFDQRGVASSGGLTCPMAAATYYRVDLLTGLGLDEEALFTTTSTFVEDCIEEMGDPDVLPYLGTDQVAADLATFVEILGFEEVILYGESYGTQVAQTLAADHPQHLTRMILDGTVDLTLDGFTFFEQQAAAFEATLQSTLAYCNEDLACAQDIGINAGVAYDRMAALLVEGPLFEEFPLPGGGFEERTFGLGDLQFVASAQMYGEDDRMMFLRALAAYTARDDLVPMLRLLYLDLALDPQDETSFEDPTYSDAIYYAVECLDYWYPGTTPEQRAAAFFEAGANADVNRLGTLFFGDFPCAFWPVASQDATRPQPLAADGIPTVVLGATADPATPYQQSVAVADRLSESYLIVQEGGPHVIFGRGNPCPDESVTAFILEGTPPEETECEGDVVGYYIPLLPTTMEAFHSAEAMLDAVDYEIFYLPEYYWWDTVIETRVGCNQGGTITFGATDDRDEYLLEECAFMEGLVLSGEGTYDYNADILTLDVYNGTPECAYRYQRVGLDITVEDNCAGDLFDG